jgi:nitronate monooxygenase
MTGAMFDTAATRLLGIRHPVFQAPLGGVARAELAAAVSNAGGLGMLAMIRMPPAFIRQQIQRTRELTKQPFGVNLVPAVISEEVFEAQLDVCIDEQVRVLSLFWCDDITRYARRCHEAGMKLVFQAGSAAEARRAVDAGADIIVAQGAEAGGHVRGTVGLMALLPAVVDAVAPTPVLAAGGIVNGRGLAAALALGADGAYIGTRFLVSQECEAHPDYQQRLIDAAETDTICCETFHVGWENAPHRVLRNALTDGRSIPSGPIGKMRRPDGTLVDVMPFATTTPSANMTGNTELMANYAGQGVGLIREIMPAAKIVERIVEEAGQVLAALPWKRQQAR